MANSFWNFATTFTAGTLAKAEDVNTNYQGVEAGFDSVEAEINKCIQLTNLEGKTIDISENAASRALKIVSFDASGNVVAVVNIGSWQDDWSDGHGAYYVRDIVRDAAGTVSLNSLYMCNTEYTPGGGDTIGTAIANWDIIIDLTDVVASETAAAASASAASTSETNADTSATLASNWATKISGDVSGGEQSSKAYAIGGTNVTDTAGKGAAKEWATKAEDSTVDTSGFSALHWAAKAAASAGTLNLPTLSGGDVGKMLEVNVAENGYDLIAQGSGGGIDSDTVDGHEGSVLLNSNLIPAGTAVVFYQAAAPTGWTQTTDDIDFSTLRVMNDGTGSATGGGTGGTHDLNSPPATTHVHQWYNDIGANTDAQTYDAAGDPVNLASSGAGTGHNIVTAGTITGESRFGVDGFTTSVGPTAFAPKYVDVILCSKD